MFRNLLFVIALLIIPTVVFAQVIFPNRGGTGNATTPDVDELLIGNGTAFDLKRIVAGDNVSISTSSSLLTISASLEGGGLAAADIDTEAELEALVTDVSNFFTNNDGALADDDLSDNDLDDLANTLLFDPNADEIVFWDDSDGRFEFIDTFTGLTLTGNTLALVTSGDWTGTLDGVEGAAFALDTDVDDLSGVSNAATARTNLGLAIGTDVQAFSAALADISALSVTDGNIIVADGLNWVAESGATARTSLGLGSLATLSSIGPANLTATDFGDFTVAASTASLDANVVGDNEIDYTAVTLSDFTNDASFITSADDSVSGSELDGVFSTTGLLKRTGAATYTTITDSSANWNTAFGWGNHATQGYLTTVDISADTNLVAGTGLTLTGDTLSNDLGTSIDTSEIDADTITHANIADADQADTKCVYIEDPTADDDLQSIWANKTANDFLITEIWAESDQTVAFDLQIDDGTAADVNGTDITPAAGEAEDTTLSGDTTLAAGEELDLVITSVTSAPTWVSICWTGNWVD